MAYIYHKVIEVVPTRVNCSYSATTRTGPPGRNKPIKTLTETSGLVASRDGK